MEPFPPLYHYTDLAGLTGMSENKTLRMTNVRYMNDTEEFIYGLKFVRDFIANNYDKSLGKFLNDPELKYQEIPPLFSFSLSENKDLLSQWRGYCPNGGYSISFDEQLLKVFIKKNSLRIERCRYDIDDIEDYIIKEIVRITPESYYEKLKSPFYNKVLERMPYDLVRSVFQKIPFIKHNGFHEEKEWRIVNDEHHERPIDHLSDLKTRIGKRNHQIPYLEYSLDGYGEAIFTKAIIFPGDKQTLEIEEIKQLIKSDKVLYSTIPYRG
jgi:hypothetical protein